MILFGPVGIRVILNIKVLTKTLLNMPGREKENLDNLLHMSQCLDMDSFGNQISELWIKVHIIMNEWKNSFQSFLDTKNIRLLNQAY